MATTSTRLASLEFLEKWTGFWIVTSCQPHAHVKKQLPKIFQGWLHHTFGSPSLNPVKITCHPKRRAEFDQLQDKLSSCSRNTWVL